MRAWLVVLVLVVPSVARAQSVAEPRSWTATPFIGLSFGTGEGLNSSIGLGAAVGYDLTANLGFEGEVARAFDIASDDDAVDWSVTNVHVNAVYHFDVIRVTPYATFGLGLERSGIDRDDAEPLALTLASTTEVAYNFGGGLKYKVGDTMLARADLRRFQANDSAPDYWRVYGGLTFVWRR
jgi:opacity protein-like surface antigen